MQLSLRDLQFFVAAADHMSITAAAAGLNVSQPSVSLALQRLEDRLGVQLLVRQHARGVALTAAGVDVLREARKLLTQVDDFEKAAKTLSDEPQGSLRIGCLAYLVPRYVPALLSGFERRFPNVTVDFIEGDQTFLIHAISTGEVELALSYDLDLPRSISAESLLELPPYAVVGEQHRFAKRRRIALRDLAEDPVILLNLPISRDYYARIFDIIGVTPRILHRSNSVEAVRGLVAHGLGFSILNHRSKSKLAADGHRIIELELSEKLPPARVSMLTAKGMRPRYVVEAFVFHVKDCIQVI
mgnify:CR=1 FL=1